MEISNPNVSHLCILLGSDKKLVWVSQCIAAMLYFVQASVYASAAVIEKCENKGMFFFFFFLKKNLAVSYTLDNKTTYKPYFMFVLNIPM